LITSRARIVLILFAASLLAAQISGRSFFYNLTYLWAGLLIFSYLWSRSALRGVRLERQTRTPRAQVGELFIERFRISNESRFPKLWVETRDASDLPGYRVTAVAVGLGFKGASLPGAHQAVTVTSGIAAGRSRSWLMRTLCTQRGRFRLGPITMSSSDPFGIFPVAREIPVKQHVVVLPMIIPLSGFPLPSGRLPGGEALRQRTHQITPNAAGVRDYAPGDSFSRIHWKSTARRRKLIVKEFELDPLAEIWVIVDGASNVHAEKPPGEDDERERADDELFQLPPSSEEYAVTAAASIAYHFLQRGRAVGLIAYGAMRNVIQPEPGDAQQYRLLESLAVFKAEGGVGLENVLKVESPRIPQGATVIMITPSASTDLLSSVHNLFHAGRQTVLVSLDAETFGGKESNAAFVDAASRSGVIVRRIQYGDELGAALGSAARRPYVVQAA
jgi:uncharacterized protein (DUF58 family)